MYHSLLLGNEFGDEYTTKLTFCAAFIHDMERLHDGFCKEHGVWAARYALPKFRDLFISIGVQEMDLDVIVYATTKHSLPDRGFISGIYGNVAKLLKDADGLDRVRLGDFNPRFLRFPFSKKYVHFAEKFYWKTEKVDIKNFDEVIDIAESI
ncbi:MAG: hypothetical protein JXL97_01130 [Bacteroidales bacterium]|nr:hypothetical protein [Bacteroidales bacterium]